MNKPFACGRRSKLYLKPKSTVLKLYNKGFSDQRVHEEYLKAFAVWEAHKLNVPKPILEIEENSQKGILFEKIEGSTFMSLLQKKPWQYFSLITTIITVHKSIHSVHIANLPTQQDKYTQLIEESGRIPTEDKHRLVAILNKRHNPVLCHGDFHHGNLIRAANGDIYILDWMDAFTGAFQLDVALTAVNAVVSNAPAHVPLFYRKIYDVLKTVFNLDARYLNAYGLKDAKEYIFLAAGIHLARHERGYSKAHYEYFEASRRKGLLDTRI